jgi:vacuolar-type H+-ATPase subunit I/STV1
MAARRSPGSLDQGRAKRIEWGMNFRRVASIYGSAAMSAGFLLMGWGPMFLRYFGDLVHADNGTYSLIRLAGVGFFLAGAGLLAVRTVPDLAPQRRISFAMVAAHMLGGLVVWAQQSAIWGSALGVALDGWLWLASVSFALVLIGERQRRSAVRA